MSLDDIMVDEQEMNEKELSKALKGKINVGKDSGELFFQEGFHDHKSEDKLALVMLARKAADIQGVIEDEKAKTKKFEELTGMPKGTIKTALKSLRDKNLAKSDNGEYWIPNPNITRIKEKVQED
ncbi:MAG: hypothetical protein ABEJ95_03430 [Candidatus Nanohalobium sp.]